MRGFRIICQSYDHRVLDESVHKLCRRFIEQDYFVKGPIPLPLKRTLFTVLSSPFVYKTARFQAGLHLSKRMFIIYKDKDVESAALLGIIEESNVGAGVKLKVNEYEF